MRKCNSDHSIQRHILHLNLNLCSYYLKYVCNISAKLKKLSLIKNEVYMFYKNALKNCRRCTIISVLYIGKLRKFINKHVFVIYTSFIHKNTRLKKFCLDIISKYIQILLWIFWHPVIWLQISSVQLHIPWHCSPKFGCLQVAVQFVP